MDGSLRPGNPDRGWNDPPMFNYNTVGQPSPKTNLLNKRVAPPQQQIGSKPGFDEKVLPSRMASAKYNPEGVGAPPMTSPPKVDGPVTSAAPPTACQSESNPSQDEDIELALQRIQTVLNECENKLKKRIFEDITKRLGVLRDKWMNMSMPVKVYTSKLANSLVNYQYDEAYEIHLTLMVDHVTEVSQWMVGIKRLIHEAKTIRPTPSDVQNESNTEPSEDITPQLQLFDTNNFQSLKISQESEDAITQGNKDVADVADKSSKPEDS
ncbi:steroid receptor RNA activator 1-like isoform X2 [Antedon mediterranea]|uniref:steroid receptor RNA activator 1-like isoform X2 n=1 Tax=Antedon mediterranea TaxID=105859 RepID=UPI003AF97CBF